MRKIREEVNKIKQIMGVIKEASARKPKYINRTNKNPGIPFSSKELTKRINSYFPPCSQNNQPCIGKITTDDCKTDLGILGGEFSEKNFGLSDSNWSVLNRFDTNKFVWRKIWEIYETTTEDISYQNWVSDNFSEFVVGKYVKELAEINAKFIKSGYDSEDYARKIIRKIFGEKIESITTHCAGDFRDRKLGRDLDVKMNGQSYYFQIKSLSPDFPLDTQIRKYSDIRGPYYEVVSFNHADKYTEENVDVIMYVMEKKDLYILFANDKNHIATLSIKVYNKSLPQFLIRYYEEPIASNLSLEEIVKLEKTKKQSIESEKQQKMNYYRQRISFFQDLINKLEQSKD